MEKEGKDVETLLAETDKRLDQVARQFTESLPEAQRELFMQKSLPIIKRVRKMNSEALKDYEARMAHPIGDEETHARICLRSLDRSLVDNEGQMINMMHLLSNNNL